MKARAAILTRYQTPVSTVNALISRRFTLDEINAASGRLGRGEVARGVMSFPV